MSVQSTPVTGSAVTGTDLVGVTVTDLRRVLAFYRDQLGMVPSRESENGAEFHLPDGTTFGIWQPPESEDLKPGFGVMFTVGDAAGAAQQIRARGGAIGDAFESPVCHMAMGTDPEGNSFITHQKKARDPHLPPDQARTPTTINGIDLAGYMVAEPQAAIAFYRDVVGMKPSWTDEQGRGAEFEFADGSTFGVWHEAGAPTGGFVMFAVDDARAKLAELRERGVRIGDADESPNCIMAISADPEGNCVVIHQRKVHA